eukprot:1455842-Ditylum_brightwellii.AAC.1
MLCITDTGHNPIHDHGEMATLPKSNHNTFPLPCPCSFGNAFHCEIFYGTGTAIRRAMKLFVCDIGGSPPFRMIANWDFKLIGGMVHKFLTGVHLDSPDGTTI